MADGAAELSRSLIVDAAWKSFWAFRENFRVGSKFRYPHSREAEILDPAEESGGVLR